MTKEQLQELKEMYSKDELIGIMANQETTIYNLQNMLESCTKTISNGYRELEERYRQLQIEYTKLEQCEERYIDGINKREAYLKYIKELEDKVCRQRVALNKLKRLYNEEHNNTRFE